MEILIDVFYKVMEILMETWRSHRGDVSWTYVCKLGEFNGDIEILPWIFSWSHKEFNRELTV